MRRRRPRIRASPWLGHAPLRISIDGAYFLFCGAPQKRKGLDSLAQLCREKLQDDPMSGCLYLFRNRRGDTIIALCYDGQGLWHCRKRLSQGRFRFWVGGSGDGIAQALEAHQAQLLLAAGDPATAVAPVWRPIHGK